LFDACCKHGFLLLDLNSSSQGDVLLTDTESMFDLATELSNWTKASSINSPISHQRIFSATKRLVR
jgi:hypothetical protein